MSVHVATEQLGELYCAMCESSFEGVTSCPRDGSRLVRLAPPHDPMIGRELDGRYTILEKLGSGGMGAVYRATQHSVSREVVIKVVHANLASDPEVIKRFLREAKLASQLSHPNTVAVLDFGQTPDGLFYLVMELITGRTLESVYLTDGRFDARRLVRLGVQLCDALEAAHALSIVHRDLKPANIMLLDNTRDSAKVLDFGLAKSLETDAAETTKSGAMCGTPAFIAPERACGQPCDHRSDLYSLGCILYLLGSGHLPFTAGSMHELLTMQVHQHAPPMTGVPLSLADVIDRLLLKDPAARWQTAAELRDALEEAVPLTMQMAPISRPHQIPSVPGGYETAPSLPLRPSANHIAGRRPPTASELQDFGAGATHDAAVVPHSRRRWWLAAAAAALIGAVTFAAVLSRDSAPPPAPLPVTTVAPPPDHEVPEVALPPLEVTPAAPVAPMRIKPRPPARPAAGKTKLPF
ncbi:MAG: protein kinase [Deltaproteobacteria bacterium]|nr:protein kinase [Deltaproteobacteria bacterium]